MPCPVARFWHGHPPQYLFKQVRPVYFTVSWKRACSFGVCNGWWCNIMVSAFLPFLLTEHIIYSELSPALKERVSAPPDRGDLNPLITLPGPSSSVFFLSSLCFFLKFFRLFYLRIGKTDKIAHKIYVHSKNYDKNALQDKQAMAQFPLKIHLLLSYTGNSGLLIGMIHESMP